MTEYNPTPAQLRHQLEIAQTLAKSRIGFVVVPVTNLNELALYSQRAVEALEELANGASERKD